MFDVNGTFVDDAVHAKMTSDGKKRFEEAARTASPGRNS